MPIIRIPQLLQVNKGQQALKAGKILFKHRKKEQRENLSLKKIFTQFLVARCYMHALDGMHGDHLAIPPGGAARFS